MPLYKDNAQNKRLKRVGMGYGKECSPCKVKKKSAPKEDEKGKLKLSNNEYVTKEKFISEIEAKGYKFTPSQIKYIDRFIGSSIKISKYLNPSSKNYIIDPVSNDIGLYREEYKKRFRSGSGKFQTRIVLKPI